MQSRTTASCSATVYARRWRAEDAFFINGSRIIANARLNGSVYAYKMCIIRRFCVERNLRRQQYNIILFIHNIELCARTTVKTNPSGYSLRNNRALLSRALPAMIRTPVVVVVAAGRSDLHTRSSDVVRAPKGWKETGSVFFFSICLSVSLSLSRTRPPRRRKRDA